MHRHRRQVVSARPESQVFKSPEAPQLVNGLHLALSSWVWADDIRMSLIIESPYHETISCRREVSARPFKTHTLYTHPAQNAALPFPASFSAAKVVLTRSRSRPLHFKDQGLPDSVCAHF